MPVVNIDQVLSKLEGFDWNQGNIDKNLIKHFVSAKECEEAFFNKPLKLSFDKKHSNGEKRFQVLGQTDKSRRLFIAFTVRKNKIRVFSARDQNKKERIKYAKKEA